MTYSKSEPRLRYGRRLKRMRERAGLTQLEVSKRLQYGTKQFISNWERGVSLPPDAALRALAEIMQQPLREIIAMTYMTRISELDTHKRKLIRSIANG